MTLDTRDPTITEALLLNTEDNAVLRRACQTQFNALHQHRRALATTVPPAAYDALVEETDKVMAVWQRLSSMPEVGER